MRIAGFVSCIVASSAFAQPDSKACIDAKNMLEKQQERIIAFEESKSGDCDANCLIVYRNWLKELQQQRRKVHKK